MRTQLMIASCRQKKTTANSIKDVESLRRYIRADSRISILELRTPHCSVNFFQNFPQSVTKFPAGIVFLKFAHIADPPDVVAHLFPFISEDPIRSIFYCAYHQVRKKTM